MGMVLGHNERVRKVSAREAKSKTTRVEFKNKEGLKVKISHVTWAKSFGLIREPPELTN